MSIRTLQKSLGYKKTETNSRLCFYKANEQKTETSFVKEISYSLTQPSKFISPKFFYDDLGSEIFEKICDLPEYYLTRTEIQILKSLQNDLPSYLNGSFRLVELGSGSSTKTRLILDVLSKLQNKVEYFPIDISEILKEGSVNLLDDYPNLHITGIIDTYDGGLEFVRNFDEQSNLIAFLGSSFGNFVPADGHSFLNQINSSMKNNDLFLIGLDLVKEKHLLEDAYDDSKGITAKFNLNVLNRINHELDADFDISKFEHHALYNDEKQRVEMYLRSTENQQVCIQKAQMELDFTKDELIHTEHSHKYTIEQIHDLMSATGFEIKQIWQDKKQHYAMILATKKH